MLITKRQKDMIQVLLSATDCMTVQEIADRLAVSQRTIYRELPSVTKIIDSHGMKMTSTSKKGLCITGDARLLKQDLDLDADLYITDPKERADYVLMYLLHENDYMKAEAIADDNQVSVTTVRSDLDKISKQLSEGELYLHSQRGAGYKIEGTDMEKNHMLVNLVMKRCEEDVLYRWLKDPQNGGNAFLMRLEAYGYSHTMRQCYRIIDKGVEKHKYFGDHELIRFILLISLMMIWHRNGHPYAEALDSNVKDKRTIQRVQKGLESEFSTHLSHPEQQYLYWVWLVTIHQQESDINALRNHTLNTKMHRFIAYVEEHMGIHFKEDKDMITGLYVHMDKAIHRIRSGISVSNPLVSQTKKEYGELFSVIQEGLKATFPDLYFPPDEIGYLLFYFAVALDEVIKRAFRILVVCSGGMGSSRMLANRVEQEIPEVRVAKVTSLMGMSNEDVDSYDLILATIPLYIDKNKYLRVSPLLNDHELQRVREAIQHHKYGKLRRIDQREQESHRLERIDSIEKLTQIDRLSTIGLDLTGKFNFYSFDECKDIAQELSSSLRSYGYQGDIQNFVLDASFIIPTTKILYCEEKLPHLSSPLIFVHHYHLEHSDPIHSSIFSSIVFMIYPEHIERFEKRMLMHLIETLFENKDILNYIEHQEEAKAQQLLAYQINRYIHAL